MARKTDEELRQELGENVSKEKYYVLDSYPGIYFEDIQVLERMGLTTTVYSKSVQIFLEKHYFFISMITFNNKNLLEANTKLFHLLANSVIFLHQYEN